MENNAHSKGDTPAELDFHRLVVLEWKNAVGSYRLLADQMGIKNPSYLSNYVNHGVIPGNLDIRDRLGIVDCKLEYTRNRNARLNDKARAVGWAHLSEYLTAVLHGQAEIPEKI